MNKGFSEALAPLAARMPRAVRDIEILRVASQIDGDDFEKAQESARREVLQWAKNRAGGQLPPEAWDFKEFDLPRGGRNSSAVRISDDTMDLWALRAEDPDAGIAGRVWSTEVVIGGRRDERPFFSMRLIASTHESSFAVEPAVPGLVRQLIETPGLVRGGRPLADSPRLIETENGMEDLCDHLEDSERRLPVVLVTLPEGSSAPLIDDRRLAKATAGIGRVVRIPSEMSWILTRRFGRFRSVFGGAVRVYMPGFSSIDDPYRHRLFVADAIASTEDSKSCVSWLRKTIADLSISHTRLGQSILDFSSVRAASRRLQKSVLVDQEAPDAELLATATELVESLEEQIAEKDKEIDVYIEVSEEAEARAETAEQENRALLYKIRQLEKALKEGGAAPTAEPPMPQEWPEFLDWVDGTYPDKVVLTPSARRMVRSPDFEDVEQVARAIRWLANEHYETRVNGGESLRDVPLEEGVRNAPCGGDAYKINWKDRPYTVDWHIKTGGNSRNPKKCLRIYYFWEKDTQQTVIDHLPSHRTTSAS